MAEAFKFEVRPIEGATAVIGEEVTFRSEGGRLYALNEDGEAFGTVPKAVAARLEEAGVDSLAAEVASRAGGVPTISVMEFGSGEASTEVAAEPEQIATPSQTVSATSSTGLHFSKAAQPSQTDAGIKQASTGSHFSKAAQPVEDEQSVEDAQSVKGVSFTEDSSLLAPAKEGASASASSLEEAASEGAEQEDQPKKHKHRAIGAVVVIAVVALLAAYSFLVPHKAANVSDDMYETGLEVVEVVNDYLDGYLSTEVASEELDDLAFHAEVIEENSEKSGDSFVYNRIVSLQFDFSSIELSETIGFYSSVDEKDDLEDMEEDLEELEDRLYAFHF